MPVFDIFSKRAKRGAGGVPDVFCYDRLPHELRVQIVHIVTDATGTPDRLHDRERDFVFTFVHDVLCREHGLLALPDDDGRLNRAGAVLHFLLNTESVEQVLDAIEMLVRLIDTYVRENPRLFSSRIEPDDAIEELNKRFLENGIGYQYQSEQIVRVDSLYVHDEVVKPALQLLSETRYRGANEEFLSAHSHYTKGNYKECMVSCLSAFESTMKIIAGKHGWRHKDSDTAKQLIQLCLDKGLIPNYLQSQFSALRSVLESGVPTVRNKLAGHGQGEELVHVPRHMAEYALNLTATSILFLVECERALDGSS